MMADQRQVAYSDVVVGEPLPFALCDANGVVLLKAGFVIRSQRHLDALIAEGLFIQPSSCSVVEDFSIQATDNLVQQNAFEMLDLLKIQLRYLFEQTRKHQSDPNWIAQLVQLASCVQRACDVDASAALANLYLDHQSHYIVVHSLQSAIICELIARRLNLPASLSSSVCCAALTQGLGLLDIQEMLDKQNSPLSLRQTARVRAHPFDGVAILASLGVKDLVWLSAVQQHHERLDGSGYPCGLKGDEICLEARLLSVADIYSAMVRVRPYRRALLAKEIMSNLLLLQSRNIIDAKLIQHMVDILGVFPPGVIVRLKNAEVAVIKEIYKDSQSPQVFAFLDVHGVAYSIPVLRDTTDSHYAIEGIVSLTNYLKYIALIRSVWLGN